MRTDPSGWRFEDEDEAVDGPSSGSAAMRRLRNEARAALEALAAARTA